MKPADDPKVAVIKDGDRWTAIIGDERFERFGSEADAWGFVRCTRWRWNSSLSAIVLFALASHWP